MKLFYATKNKFKIQNMKDRLKDFDIEIITPYDIDILLEIDENGSSVIENALIKAKAYYKLVNMPVISGDSSLFVDKFQNQPGLFIRRINGKYLSDDEIEENYIKELKKVGGKSDAYYITGLVLINNNIINSIEIIEDKFIFTSNIYEGNKSEDPLGRLEFDININKYFCEMTDDDKKIRNYKFDRECVDFIVSNIFNE